MIRLPPDFKEFLKLLNDHEVDYLVIGGWPVIHYGYVRATGDLDVWIAMSSNNAKKVLKVLTDFGFGSCLPDRVKLLTPNRIIRMGAEPHRIEISTTIDGVTFDECFSRRQYADLDGVEVPMIHLDDLRRNKIASGRAKDIADLQNLPE